MYTYKINKNNQFIIYQNGEEVYQSRDFRLRVQAERQAKKFIQKMSEAVPSDSVRLDVQNMSIDPDTILGGQRG